MNPWTVAELRKHLAAIQCELLRCHESRQTSNALSAAGKAQSLRYNRLSAQKQDYIRLIEIAEED